MILKQNFTKISKTEQNDLVIAYYCPSCAITVTPDHEEIIDCPCGLIATKDKFFTNDELFVAVVNGYLEINLKVNLSMFLSYYGIVVDSRSLQSGL